MRSCCGWDAARWSDPRSGAWWPAPRVEGHSPEQLSLSSWQLSPSLFTTDGIARAQRRTPAPEAANRPLARSVLPALRTALALGERWPALSGRGNAALLLLAPSVTRHTLWLVGI